MANVDPGVVRGDGALEVPGPPGDLPGDDRLCDLEVDLGVPEVIGDPLPGDSTLRLHLRQGACEDLGEPPGLVPDTRLVPGRELVPAGLLGHEGEQQGRVGRHIGRQTAPAVQDGAGGRLGEHERSLAEMGSRFNRIVGWCIAVVAAAELLGTAVVFALGWVSALFALGFSVLLAGFACLGVIWARFHGGWR